MHEAQEHRDNSFITLTYKDEHLTYGYSQATLVKDDLQKFWKRLRKVVPNAIRYFACGEYGECGARPHYHACLFGFDFPDKTILRSENGRDLYHSDLLDSAWTHGHCSVGALTASSAAYVARYIMDKKLGKERDYYVERGIEPEFIVMSRGGKTKKDGTKTFGIGGLWFSKYAGDIYPQDRVVTEGGFESRPPRYYDNLRKAQKPQEIEEIKIRRMQEMDKVPIEERLVTRMRAKIRFQELRIKSFQKKLH